VIVPKIRLDVVLRERETVENAVNELTYELSDVTGRPTGEYTAGSWPEVEFSGPWPQLINVLVNYLDGDGRNAALGELLDLVAQVEDDVEVDSEMRRTLAGN
jgi:hypothetical protein